MTKAKGERVLAFLEELNTVIGVLSLKEETLEIPPEIQKAFEKRQSTKSFRVEMKGTNNLKLFLPLTPFFVKFVRVMIAD